MTLILVDTSYTSFYRFFATLRWLSLSDPDLYKEKKNDSTYDWSKNEKFMEKYEKMYMKSIVDLVGKKIFDDSKVIFCMDSPKENVWRNEIMKGYKADRCDLSAKTNFKPAFNETYTKLIPKIIKDSKDRISKIRLDKLEADDIIAVIAKYYEKKYPDEKVYLISGDKDFLQLGRENLIFINYKSKKPVTLSKEEAREQLKLKILNGDCSDNILTIFPKDRKLLSLKKRKELIEDETKLKEYLQENSDINDKYKINCKMIDFKYIPKDLEKEVLKEFKKTE
jgi:5'-3' exonuclease